MDADFQCLPKFSKHSDNFVNFKRMIALFSNLLEQIVSDGYFWPFHIVLLNSTRNLLHKLIVFFRVSKNPPDNILQLVLEYPSDKNFLKVLLLWMTTRRL